jgi:hypothetical protein
MKTRTILLWFLLATLISLHSRQAPAQPVSIDFNSFGPIDGFELYDNGYYWWGGGMEADEIDPGRTGQIALRTLLADRWLVVTSSRPYAALQTKSLKAPFQSVARNDELMFYFIVSANDVRIKRRAIFGDNPVEFSGSFFNEAGAILLDGVTVYFSVRGGAASSSGEIRYKSANGPLGGGDVVLGSGMGLVRKMKMIPLVDESGAQTRLYLYLLNTSGELWRIRVPSLVDPNPTPGSPTFFAGNVSDFDAREESELRFDGGFLHRVHATRLYATTGIDNISSPTSGKLVAFNLTSGGSTIDYDSRRADIQLTGVTVDSQRIFITITPLVLYPDGIWRYNWIPGTLNRRNSPANTEFPGSSDWEMLASQQEFRNLRTDTQWLYYADRQSTWKISTTAPGQRLDFAALGLEAVQALQDFNNSVPLVAGKPTIVRGYAQVLENTTSRSRFRVPARLRAFRNGVQLTGDESEYSRPSIDNFTTLANLRSNLNRSFLFNLPPEWLNETGPLELEMTVNPLGTGENANFANNVARATVNVIAGRTPCLVFKPMSSPMGNYDLAGIDVILERATLLMPVNGFKWYTSSESVRKITGPFGLLREPFIMPGDSWQALIQMTMVHAFSSDPPGCEDTHWIGTFPANIGTWNGIGGIRGSTLSDWLPETPIDFTFPRTALYNTACVRMDSGPSAIGNPWGSIRGGHSLAHELSHNYGRFHIDQTRSPTGCGGSPPDRPWHNLPGGMDACTLGNTDLASPTAPIGYDSLGNTLVWPAMAGDLMTYSPSRWVTAFTWNALVGAIPVYTPPAGGAFGADFLSPLGEEGQAAAAGGGVFMVQGFINLRTRTATLLPLWALPPGTIDHAKVQESLNAAARLPADAPHRLRLLNAAGNVLDDRALVPLAGGDSDNGIIAFVQAVPNISDAKALQVRYNGTMIGGTTASPNAPVLSLNAPRVDSAQETLTLDWTASDADGDAVLFTSQFSADDGASWQTLSIYDSARGFTDSTRLLRGGNACRLRVLATDGFRTTIATTAPFALPRHRPVVTISGVFDRQQIPFNADLAARALAYDAEDGSLGADRIFWTATGPETRNGRGASFSLKGLAPGDYMLGAQAPDVEGNTGSAALSVKIRPLELLDGPAPEVDGLGGDDGYSDTTQVRLAPNRSAPAAYFVHALGYLYVSFDGLPYSEPNLAPANINFYLNADNAPTGSPQSDDVGFGVDENGVPARARGTGSGWTSELPQSFTVKTLRSAASWSAEFRIPDTAFNGWNHNAAILISFGYAYCIARNPDGSCLAASGALKWPGSGDVFNPNTWASISLGPLPPLTNRPPVAVASGPSVVSFTGAEVVPLNGSASYDLDGDPLAFSWTQASGPAVTLTGANTATPSFTTPALNSTAIVTLQLTVSDGALASVPAQVQIVLAPAALPSPGTNGTRPVTINVANGSATIQLDWPAAPGSLAIIQASQDLIHWENIATNSANYLGVLLQTDLQAGQYRYRFYRAVSLETPATLWPSELSFDGANDFVEVPHSTALNALPLTITAWFRTSQSVGSLPGLITKYHGDDLPGYGIGLDRGHLTCWYLVDFFSYIIDDGADGAMPFVADGQWHHVAFAVDAAGGRVYLDGSLVRFTPWEGFPAAVTTTQPVRFGWYPGETGLFYNGDLDEVALWSRALTATEVNQQIPGTLTGSESGLLGYWNLNEGTGQIAGDVSGHGRNGTLINGPTWYESSAPLRPNPTAGSALRFDGVDDLVQVPHHPALNAFPLTVAGWIKTAQDSPGYIAVANKYTPGSGNGYSLHIHDGRMAGFYFRGDGASYVYAGDPGLDGGFIADGRWHHVAFAVDANGGRIYIDGAQSGSLGWTGTPGGCTTTVPFQSGQYPFGAFLDGRIDELTLWNRALDTTEINAVMNHKQAGGESGLIGFWPFDNGSGTTATDATGHGHNGALQNGPLWVPSDALVFP